MRLQDLDLEVVWWGDASAHDTSPQAPIVLLHEGLGSVASWRDFPAMLAQATRRRIMAYSRLGHGGSDPPAQPHTVGFMHAEAQLLPEIFDAARIDRAILFGHSDGGSIALIAAAEQPSRVSALILEAPHVFVEDISIASIEATTRAYRAGHLRERLARYHDNVDVAFSGWSEVWLDPEFRAWNLEEFLARITCPTLLIQGLQDEYGTLRQIDAIERQVSGPVERLVLDNCGHSPHRDQREAVLNSVSRFVAAISV